MTLQEYEQLITRYAALDLGEPALDDYGQREYSSDASECADRIWSHWQTIRVTLWSAPYREEARRLERLCETSLERLARDHGLMPAGRPPRFPAYTDGAGNLHDAID